MKTLRAICFAAFILSLSYLTVSAEEVLTNDAVISMLKAGLGEELVISKINHTRNQFDVSIDGILKLKAEGVSESIVKNMVESAGTAGQVACRPDEGENLYKQAITLKEDLQYDDASAILKKLAAQNSETYKYQIQYVDTLLEQIIEGKRTNDSSWESKAKEAQLIISNYAGNPKFYLIYTKYIVIIDQLRGKDPYHYLSKAANYRVDANDPWTKIITGDIYFWLARYTKRDSSANAGGANLFVASSYQSDELSLKAKSFYEGALATPNITANTEAYIYYRMGELEYWLIGTPDTAKGYWAKTVAISNGGRIAEMAIKAIDR